MAGGQILMFGLFGFAVLLWLCLVDARDTPIWLGSNARPVQTQAQKSELERLASPVQVGSARYASQLFNGRQTEVADGQQQVDLFQCMEPSRPLFENFSRQFQRNFNGDSSDELERYNLFMVTLKRIITLNRIIQNEILNATNYDLKPTIRNYNFIAPLGAQNSALWFADITDCELGLIKYIMFDLFHLIERGEFALAYKLAKDSSEHLPLQSELGWEQLANILIVRLYDRFKEDDKMNQLFQWPLYLKKLAGYAYSQNQASQADFKARLSLVVYAYPSYFKDIKYNAPAVNRTNDNLRAHADHEKFNKILKRKFINNEELNKRLAIFRQRWSYVNMLNEDGRWNNSVAIQPDWLRINRPSMGDTMNVPTGSGSVISRPSERLMLDRIEDDAESEQAGKLVGQSEARFRHTQFSDLTNAEFVAYLTNDFSLLGEESQTSSYYIRSNFPIRALDEKFRGELAHELELRRAILFTTSQQQQQQQQVQSADSPTSLSSRDLGHAQLARKVIDELISDVGLPIGSVLVDKIPENEHYEMFQQLKRLFSKTYSKPVPGVVDRWIGKITSPEDRSSSYDVVDEHQRRYDNFKNNHARFLAWFQKEGWHLETNEKLAMLRLADMSWTEIKLTLFKVCCLTDENLALLSAGNTTIEYWGSNDFLCLPMSHSSGTHLAGSGDLAALELYYYYCVHFNKHHFDLETFNKRFEIFRRNIDNIRRHSCTRGLTLFRSLKLKKPGTLNSIDELDTRRSYTDDINLDRYDYFKLPNLSLSPTGAEQQAYQTNNPSSNDIAFERLRQLDSASSSPSRAGVSYRREPFFSNLLTRHDLAPATRFTEEGARQARPAGLSYADKLVAEAQDVSTSAKLYRENKVHRIYDLVLQRYKLCMRTLNQVDLSSVNLKQDCQASGHLADQAATGTSSWSLQNAASFRARLQEPNQCAFYRQGLEPWSEGLIKQELWSARLIQSASC